MLNFYFEQNEELFDGADKFDFVADLMAMDLPLPADYEPKSYKVADCFAPPEKDFAVKDKTFGYTVEGEASKFKDFCNRYSISAQRAVSFLLAKAIQMTHPKNKRVISVRGPVDTRNILQTPNTFQNASVPHIFLNLDPAWLGDALPEEAIRSVTREFNEQYTYENLAAYTNWCRRGIISPDEGERQNIFMSRKKQTDIFANYVGNPIDKNLLICKFRGQVQMTVNEKQTENTRRFISTKNLKVLGKGASAVIYELSEDKILKAFTTHYTESMLLEEFRLTKAVYDAGIRTMKAYEVVETDEFLGCVYERLYAKDLVHCMREDKGRIEEYVRRFGKFVKNVHKIRLSKEKFKDAKDLMLARSKDAETLEITREEQEKLIAVVSFLPSCDNFSHGDCHVGNVMLKDGDLLLIDLGKVTRGNPLIDFSSMFIQYRYISYHNMTDAYGVSQNAVGFTTEERRLIWDTYMRSLSGLEDEKELEELERQINVIAAIRMLHVKFYNKKFLPQEVFKMFVNDITSYYDEGLQPFMKI